MYQIGVDIGGTFTDFIVSSGQEIMTLKVASTPLEPVKAIAAGLTQLAAQCNCSLPGFLAKVERFTHGNTVAINALLEKKIVKTALITTEGFRDALEIRRSRLKNQWDFCADNPVVLVPRSLRFGLKERINYKGEVLTEIDFTMLEQICSIIKQENVASVAVCLLFSFLNPVHEQQVKKYVQTRLPDVFITLSAEVAPKLGEYERTSTTVLNACLSPLVSDYLYDLESYLKTQGLTTSLLLVQNNGGLTDLTMAKEFGVKGILSGPAAGAFGGQKLAKEINYPHLIIADMGGTSFDVSLVQNYASNVIPEAEIEGHPVTIPMIDITSIGTGGGSIAEVDSSGFLSVGPKSAGAIPGPACYDLGGDEPTITDAAVVLGMINADYFSAGALKLNRQAAFSVLRRHIAEKLRISVEEAALAIYKIAASNMMNAIHLMTVQKGYNPRDFWLAACGGAMPLFAGEVAQGLGIKKIIIPSYAAVFCAYGMLHSSLKTDFVCSCLKSLSPGKAREIDELLRQMLQAAKNELSRQAIPEQQQLCQVFCEIRYADQHHQIPVPLASERMTQDAIARLVRDFNLLHQKFYGYMQPDKECTLVNIRVEACENNRQTDLCPKVRGSRESIAGTTKREVLWDLKHGYQSTTVYNGEALFSGNLIPGPAIIEKQYTTIFIAPGQTAQSDPSGNIIIEVRGDY